MNPTSEVLNEIRHRLELGWDTDTAYELYDGREGSPCGQCFVSSLVAYCNLVNFDPVIVHGMIKDIDDDHYWLEIDDKILDFTGDQFEELELPKVVFGTYDDYPSYIPDRKVSDIRVFRNETGYKRFQLLLQKICDSDVCLNRSSEMSITEVSISS